MTETEHNAEIDAGGTRVEVEWSGENAERLSPVEPGEVARFDPL